MSVVFRDSAVLEAANVGRRQREDQVEREVHFPQTCVCGLGLSKTRERDIGDDGKQDASHHAPSRACAHTATVTPTGAEICGFALAFLGVRAVSLPQLRTLYFSQRTWLLLCWIGKSVAVCKKGKNWETSTRRGLSGLNVIG